MIDTEIKIDFDNKDEIKQFLDKASNDVISSVRNSISKAVDVLRDNVKSNIQSSHYALSRSRTGRYSVPLIDGVKAYMYSNMGSNPTGAVDILGNRRQNDGTWQLRYFEGGTKPRYQKNGRYTGQIKPQWFFRDAVQSSQQQAKSLVQSAIQKAIDNINAT